MVIFVAVARSVIELDCIAVTGVSNIQFVNCMNHRAE